MSNKIISRTSIIIWTWLSIRDIARESRKKVGTSIRTVFIYEIIYYIIYVYTRIDTNSYAYT